MDAEHASALCDLQVTYRVTFTSASDPRWEPVSFDSELFSPHLKYWAQQNDNKQYGRFCDLFLSTPTRLPERPPVDLEAGVFIVVNDGRKERVLPWRLAGTVAKPLFLKDGWRRNDIYFSKGACMSFDDRRLKKIEMLPLKEDEPSLWDLLRPFAHHCVLKRRRDTLIEELEQGPAKRRRIDEEHAERVAEHEQRQKDTAAALACVTLELAQ
jgi:hypothetical protein